jgi:hypothetical protein
LGQTVLAVPASEKQLPRPVDGDQEPPVKPPAVQDLHPDQSSNDVDGQPGHPLRIHPLQIIDQGIVVGGHLDVRTGQTIEMGGENRPLGLEAKLPTRPQAQQKHQYRRPHQRRSGVVPQVRITGLRKT